MRSRGEDLTRGTYIQECQRCQWVWTALVPRSCVIDGELAPWPSLRMEVTVESCQCRRHVYFSVGRRTIPV